MKYRLDPGTLAGLLAVMAIAIIILLLTLVSRGRADWTKVAGEWEQYRLDESQVGWFKSIKAPNGVPCCDISDGHPTEMERRADGIYIPDPHHAGIWLMVPEERVVKGASNPVGVATVWYVDYPNTGTIFIRCFVPESEF